MSLEGRWCDRCDKRHTHMEICPLAPGFLELLRKWSAGEREDPMTWAAFGVALLLVFLVSSFFFTWLH
jgi:hypothetical protein